MLSARNRFQYQIATGRGTLPVAVILTLLIWAATSIHDWLNAGSLVAFGFASYLLLETETKFALIRTRTTLPAASFLLLYAATVFLHEASVACVLPALFILMLLNLFKSYESTHAPGYLFQSFLFFGLGSLLLPPLAWITPLLYIHTISLRALNARSFFAGIMGFTLPYWFLFAYFVWTDNVTGIYPYLTQLVLFQPIDYSVLTLTHYVSWGVVLLFSITFGVLYLQVAYKDKVQTRILLRVFIWMSLWLNILLALQPQYVKELLSLALIPAAMMSAHYFALTFSRISRILFHATLLIWFLFCLSTLLIWFLFCLFNLWMHFFNF